MSGISFERLPPEREAVVSPVAAAGGCCCCCCCCLHTLGGLLGAVTAKPPQVEVAGEPPIAVVGTAKVAPSYKVTREYWLTLLLLCTVALPVYLLLDGVQIRDQLEYLWFYALLLPAFQLGASLVVLIMTMASKRPGQPERLRHLGSITLRGGVGCVLGIAVMAVAAGVL